MQSGIISRTGEELFLLHWKLSNWKRVVSFTLKALELEMQSGIKVQQKLRLLNWRRVVSFTLKALELEMQSGIISRTGEELFLLRWKLSTGQELFLLL